MLELNPGTHLKLFQLNLSVLCGMQCPVKQDLKSNSHVNNKEFQSFHRFEFDVTLFIPLEPSLLHQNREEEEDTGNIEPSV